MFNGSGCLTTTTNNTSTIASMNNHHQSNSLSSAATTATSSTTSLFLGKPTTLPNPQQSPATVAPHFGQPPQLNPIISTQATQLALQQGQTSNMAQLWQLQQQQIQQQQQSLTDKYLIFMV